MTRDEAIAHHRDMEAMLARTPGTLDEEDRHRLQRIRFAFQMGDVAGFGFLREKVIDACGCLETWLSAAKLARSGHDPDMARAIVANAVLGVRKAIDRTFPGQ